MTGFPRYTRLRQCCHCNSGVMKSNPYSNSPVYLLDHVHTHTTANAYTPCITHAHTPTRYTPVTTHTHTRTPPCSTYIHTCTIHGPPAIYSLYQVVALRVRHNTTHSMHNTTMLPITSAEHASVTHNAGAHALLWFSNYLTKSDARSSTCCCC